LKAEDYAICGAVSEELDSGDPLSLPREEWERLKDYRWYARKEAAGGLFTGLEKKMSRKAAAIFNEFAPAAEKKLAKDRDFEERALELERFLDRQGRPQDRYNEDGTIYSPAPYSALVMAFEKMKAESGGLRGKRILDLGAGDLRVSLIADYLYGMKPVAVEKDPAVHAIASRNYAAAKDRFGRNTQFIATPRDAFELSWADFDIVFFYYTEPRATEDAKAFRRQFTEKAKGMKAGASLALILGLALGAVPFTVLANQAMSVLQGLKQV
jgi:hypothetical protein